MHRAWVITAVFLLALLTGVVTFKVCAYEPATLVLKAKTLEKGPRTVQVEGAYDKRVHQAGFELGSDDGALCIYSIELPRLVPARVRIAPLAREGGYQIEGLSLSNAAFSYSWDENMVCSQRGTGAGFGRKSPCGADGPSITLDADASVVVSSIPAAGFIKPLNQRLMSAFAVFVASLAGMWYLFGPVIRHEQEGLRRCPARLGWLAVILLYGMQLSLLLKYATDLPYYEEWEFFDAAALPQGLTWEWLTTQVSHQRMMVFTKLMAWLNFKLFSLDFVKLKVMNYAVFGCLVLAIVRFKKTVLGEKFHLFPLFVLFLLSPIVYEVHAASFQAGETFAVLCSVLMLFSVMREQPSYTATVAFLLCAVASMCSLSAGLVYALVFLICDTLYTVAGLQNRRIDLGPGLRNLCVRWAVFLSAMLLWFYGFKKPGTTWVVPELLLPHQGKFWDIYLNLLSFGFGVETESPVPGMVCLLFLITPVMLLMKDKETRWQAATWQVIAALAGSLAVVGLITVGRGNMGFSIKVSRYAIFGIMLIPYGAMAWWLAVRSDAWRPRVLGVLWCLLALTFYDDRDYGVYRDSRPQEILNLECVERYSNGTGDGVCPGTFVLPIGTYFDNAKALDAHFTRQFVSPSSERGR